MSTQRARILLALTALALASPAGAQVQRRTVMTELVESIEAAEQKIVGLAEAIPADKFGWRPADGVRSVGEVVMHVAADNYLLTAIGGTPAPASTGIKADDYSTVQMYEQTVPGKADAVAALKASFAHLRSAMSEIPDARLGESVNMFGRQATMQTLWLMTTTHMHEHLGQLIAYARSNAVVPPWSR
jgi:uncharacterized damage-inducible protein DinB